MIDKNDPTVGHQNIRRARRCPACGRGYLYGSLESWKPYPFCSERCRLIDLGAWLSEDYRVVEDMANESLLPDEASEWAEADQSLEDENLDG